MDSKGCLTRTPNLDVDYIAQGTQSTIAGIDAYIVQPQSKPTTGIIVCYDAFGPSTPGHLGVDILSSQLNAVVIEPDFLQGNYVKAEWLPMREETKDHFAAFREKAFGKGWEGYLEKSREVVKDATEKFGIERWGFVGFCWGGKFAVLAAAGQTPYKATIAVHPGMMDVEDAKKLTIPHRLMASKDEPAEVVKQYEKYFAEHPELQGESETYKTQAHGWAAARADLKDEEGKKEFERAYNEMTEFFHKHV